MVNEPEQDYGGHTREDRRMRFHQSDSTMAKAEFKANLRSLLSILTVWAVAITRYRIVVCSIVDSVPYNSYKVHARS